MLIAYNDQPERDSLDGNLPSTTVIFYHYNLQRKNTIHTILHHFFVYSK